MSDWQPDFAQLETVLGDGDEQASLPQKVCIYVDTAGLSTANCQAKALTSLNLARTWITESDPTRLEFDYAIIDHRRP